MQKILSDHELSQIACNDIDRDHIQATRYISTKAFKTDPEISVCGPITDEKSCVERIRKVADRLAGYLVGVENPKSDPIEWQTKE